MWGWGKGKALVCTHSPLVGQAKVLSTVTSAFREDLGVCLPGVLTIVWDLLGLKSSFLCKVLTGGNKGFISMILPSRFLVCSPCNCTEKDRIVTF